MRRRQYRIIREYSDEYEAAKALLLEVGALQEDVDGKIVVGNENSAGAYTLGAMRLLEGKIKIKKWVYPRREFSEIVYAVYQDFGGDICDEL